MIDRTHLRNFLNSIPGLEGWSDSVEHLNGVEMVLDALAEPSEEALATVIQEPTHLYGKDGRGEEYQRQMKAAVLVDRLVARQRYVDLFAARFRG